ncbi:unnamed protein product [Allacma fusca]|uniref:CRAL-TRIO domain-containing protein n=1 Tax=Allacma fusca TaxID=39272 RepID=A0A8J2KF43_9HEXA|nr:unnamed protein product [Allacma fusca]
MSCFTLFWYCLVASCVFDLTIGVATIEHENKHTLHKGNVLLAGKSVGNKLVKFPYYISGYDYEDRPVLVMEWGKWDIRTLAEKGGEELENFETSVDQFVELIRTGFFAKKVNESESQEIDVVGIVALLDFDGLSLRQIGTTKSLQLLVRNFAKLERCHGQFAYGFIVNSNPLAHQVIQLAKPFMAKFLERIEVFGSNSRKFIPELLKKIPRSQVHDAYGGTKGFRPVAVYSLI